MPILKIAIFAAVVAITVGGATVALTQSKSTSLAHLSDGDVVMINSKTGGVHKSNTRMSEMSVAGKAALTRGAKEISNDFIIYKEGGKLYMQNEANTLAAERSQMFENE